MKETLQQLIRLQRVDDDIVALAQQIDVLDHGLSGARSALDTAKAGVAAAHHARQEAQAALHRLEMDLKQAEQEILKLEGNLNTASNNKEYQGILLKIGTIKAENGKLEERILLGMDAVEEREREEDAAKSVQREREADLRAAEAKVEAERQDMARRLDELRAARDELAGSVDAEKLRLYDRIRTGNRKSGTAVVAVHGEYCQGCQMAIRPQDLSDLVSGDKIVLCRSCQRILVLEL